MTSEDPKPPDEGGGTTEDSSNDTKKSSEESTTGEKSLGSSAVAGKETSNEDSVTGEKFLGSYAFVAASARKDLWSLAESFGISDRTRWILFSRCVADLRISSYIIYNFLFR